MIKHVKTKDQLANVLTKALERVKFVDLCAKIGVQKALDEEKIKDENVGSAFLSLGTAGTCGTAVVCAKENSSCTSTAQSTCAIVLPDEMPCGAQCHTGASARVHPQQDTRWLL